MPDITVADADRRSSEDQALDVREDFEVTEGELDTRLNEIDRFRPVIVVCRSGNRSTRVADALTGAGFTADNMDGGMSAWQRAGLPVT